MHLDLRASRVRFDDIGLWKFRVFGVGLRDETLVTCLTVLSSYGCDTELNLIPFFLNPTSSCYAKCVILHHVLKPQQSSISPKHPHPIEPPPPNRTSAFTFPFDFILTPLILPQEPYTPINITVTYPTRNLSVCVNMACPQVELYPAYI